MQMTLADAIMQGKIDHVRAALERGEDVRQNNNEALFAAVKCANMDCVKLLLEHGADVNARGGMIGFVAVSEGNPTVAEVMARIPAVNAWNEMRKMKSELDSSTTHVSRSRITKQTI